MAERGKATAPKDNAEMSSWQRQLAGAVTVVFLLALLGAVYYLARMTDASDQQWTRTILALTPIQTVAFTAVGWLFGREVYRQQAQTAEARADQASAEASRLQEKASQEAQRGALLADALLEGSNADTAAGDERFSATERAGRPESPAATSGQTARTVSDLRWLAAHLYPERATQD